MPNPRINDPYTYPGTSVLINKFDLRDQDTLDRMEISVFACQDQLPLPDGKLDYAHLKAIHKHFFSDLYEWAGQERTIDIAKGGHLFAHVPCITREINKLFSALKNESTLQHLEKQPFCERLSYYFNEINAAHPFREGNGRTQRAFCNLVAEQAGYSLDWTLISTKVYIQASIDGHSGVYEPMTDIFDKIATQHTQFEKQRIEQPDNLIMEKIKQYVLKQVELTHMMSQKIKHLASDRHMAKQFSEKAVLLSQESTVLAKEILTDEIIKNMVKKPLLNSLQQQGGFTEIHQRAEKNRLTFEDIMATAKHAHSSVLSLSQTQNQSQRQGRTQS